MAYLYAGLGAVILVLGIALKVQDHRLDNAREKLATAKSELSEASEANASNLKTIAECLAVNQANTQEREAIEARARDAERRVDDLINTQPEVTPFDTPDTQCRTLTDALPAAFGKWLCSTGANCTN